MKIFEGLYLASDVDGTLLNDEHKIPRRNLEAIDYFIKNGGTFGIATGRSREAMEIYLENLPYNTNAILLNGTQIYDLTNEKPLQNIGMPEKALEFIIDLMEKFPDFGVEIFLEKSVLLCRDHPASRAHFELIKVPFEHCDIHKTPHTDLWFKLNLTGEPEYLAKMRAYSEENYSEYFSFMSSTAYFFEITNPNAGKGPAMLKNAEMMNISPKKVFAIGDNENDISMILDAHIGFAPSSAVDAVKKCANVVVCSNNDGAVADVIYYLEKNIDSI